MANVTSGYGDVWDLLNYTGELFTADMVNTPLLSMIGGLTGGVMTQNFEFPTASLYEHEVLAQENITEDESVAGITPIEFTRTQEKNVVQIFMEAVKISYVKMSNPARMSGINTAGAHANIINEKDWQIARHIESIARKVEWHLINGTYNLSNSITTANQTRGMLQLASTTNTVDASAAPFSMDLLGTLLQEMFTNGAVFKNLVMFCGGFQKAAVSNIYGYAPEDRNVGGLNIKQLETDFGNIGIAMPHRMMPAGTILLAEVGAMDIVFQPVPGKGNFFYEELAKTGAAESGQIFGQIGLSHGPAFLHGTLTNLATS